MVALCRSGLGRLLIALVLGGALAVPGVLGAAEGNRADGARPAARRGGERGSRLEQVKKAMLEVATEEQKAKIQEIVDQTRERIEAIRQGAREDRTQRRQAMQKIMQAMQEMQQQLSEVLTPEQREKVRQYLGAGGRPMADFYGRLLGNVKKLTLSEQQKQAVEKLQAEVQERVAKIRQESGGDRQAMRQAMRQLAQDVQQKVREILTPEQMRQLQQFMRESRPERGAAARRGGEGRRPGPRQGAGGDGN